MLFLLLEFHDRIENGIDGFALKELLSFLGVVPTAGILVLKERNESVRAKFAKQKFETGFPYLCGAQVIYIDNSSLSSIQFMGFRTLTRTRSLLAAPCLISLSSTVKRTSAPARSAKTT